MKKPALSLLTALGLTLAFDGVAAESRPKVDFVNGPTKVKLDSVSELQIPGGYRFIDGTTTRALFKAEGEPVSGNELGMLMPTNGEWSVIFEFKDIGYVKDDDKDKLDADKLLAAIKRGTEEGNKERARAGNAPLEIIGWEVPPKYDSQSHNLEWAIRAQSEGRPILNYNTRVLGRKGVMEVVLVINPDKLSATLPTFREVLAGHSFQTGQRYAEFRQGDKVAKYGLAALVLGGAAAGAAKLGMFAGLAVLFKKAWKLIVIALVAVASGIKKLFTGRSSRSE
jgi:uncharacterized membrane-anchored protein